MAPTRDVLDRIARVCAGELTAKALREQVVAILHSAIAFDAHVFALTDPVSLVATSPHADVPQLPWPRLPELIRWRYLTTVNLWVTLLGATGPSASLHGATRGDLTQSLMWQHVQRDLGVRDTAMTVFGDRYGCWAFLELWRTEGDPFTDAEIAFLAATTGAITSGLRSALARTFAEPTQDDPPVGPAVVMLGPDLQVHSQTAAAARTLLTLNPPDEPMPPIPAAAYNIGAALLAAEAGSWERRPSARVHLGANRWVTVKADRLGDDIAVSIEPSTAAERMDLFARAHGLSAREQEILSLLGTGLDSREIAAELVLSEHTVNDHVKAVLAKTGARTRQVLLSRVAGT